MSPVTLCVSTRNPHKLAELRALLAGLPITVVSAADRGVPEVEETGTTFADNALLKASAAWRHTGLWSLADDSGLAVDALDGAPGVFSARFAGADATDADNNQRLLEQLKDVADADRGAAFHCALVLLAPAALKGSDEGPTSGDVPDGAALHGLAGQVRGRILHKARGVGGFGYDPLFLHEPSGRTFAELAAEEKNRISHRARAFAALRGRLEALLIGART